MAGRMQNKVALVSGGASGIGAACARLLAAEGATVVATDIQSDKGAELVAELERAGHEALFLEQDVVQEAGWDRVVQHIMERYGRLDALINNAGIGKGGRLLDYSLERWRELFAVNVEGVFLGTRYCLPHLAAGDGGAIVNISSVAGFQGAPNLSAYCASKGAVRLFTKAVAKEAAAEGLAVRCNSVHPGIIDTPIWEEILDSESGIGASGENITPEAIASMAVPGGKVGRPAQVAEVAVFLCSDAASYVNGAEVAVDYGLSS